VGIGLPLVTAIVELPAASMRGTDHDAAAPKRGPNGERRTD
jgi:hypothetical protein